MERVHLAQHLNRAWQGPGTQQVYDVYQLNDNYLCQEHSGKFPERDWGTTHESSVCIWFLSASLLKLWILFTSIDSYAHMWSCAQKTWVANLQRVGVKKEWLHGKLDKAQAPVLPHLSCGLEELTWFLCIPFYYLCNNFLLIPLYLSSHGCSDYQKLHVFEQVPLQARVSENPRHCRVRRSLQILSPHSCQFGGKYFVTSSICCLNCCLNQKSKKVFLQN